MEIGDHVTLRHAVRLHGARVGSHCLIAIGAIVLDGVVMRGRVHRRRRARWSRPGRGSRADAHDGQPGQPRRTLTDADLELIHRPTNNYVKLMEQYRRWRLGFRASRRAGMRDILPAEAELRDAAAGTILAVYRRHGFRRIETPALESLELLTGGGGGDEREARSSRC